VLALGVFLIVLFGDLLPRRTLGRWRAPIEAGAAIIFVTVLVIMSGGHASPYFFGFILIVGAGALWSTGFGRRYWPPSRAPPMC